MCVACFDERMTILPNLSVLASALSDIEPFFQCSAEDACLSKSIDRFAKDLAPLLQAAPDSAPDSAAPLCAVNVSADDIEVAALALDGPLARARDNGGLTNIWAVAGLRRNEVRLSGALAELWRERHGGRAARTFLASYLDVAIAKVGWNEELIHGYRIETECRPVGECSERIDIVIRTRQHLVAVEVKIDAGLGKNQLERYVESMKRAARYESRTAHIVLLAPFRLRHDEVLSTTWTDVSTAAEHAAGRPMRNRNFSQKTLAMFGKYVRKFQ